MKKKKLISILLVVAMMFSIMPTAVWATDTAEAKWAFGTAGTAPDDAAYTNSGTLAEAFAVANGNENTTNTVTYVKLNKNITTESSVGYQLNDGKNMVLDLNEKEVKITDMETYDGPTAIEVGSSSSLTVKNGAIIVNGHYQAYVIYNEGTVYVENCNISAVAYYITETIYNEGTVYVENCALIAKANNYSCGIAFDDEEAKAYITGGSITATGAISLGVADFYPYGGPMSNVQSSGGILGLAGNVNISGDFADVLMKDLLIQSFVGEEDYSGSEVGLCLHFNRLTEGSVIVSGRGNENPADNEKFVFEGVFGSDNDGTSVIIEYDCIALSSGTEDNIQNLLLTFHPIPLKWYDEDGTEIKNTYPATGTFMEKIIAPDVTTKDNFTFVGWQYKTADMKAYSSEFWNFDNDLLTNATEFRAYWIPNGGDVFDGTGVADNPYCIKTVADLVNLSKVINSGADGYNEPGVWYKLDSNIDLSDKYGKDKESWTPIGTAEDPFKANFDGNGKSITGLYCVDDNLEYAGLFGVMDGSVVKNLTLSGMVIGYDCAGLLAGGGEDVTVTNCTFSGIVQGYYYPDPYWGSITEYYGEIFGEESDCTYGIDSEANDISKVVACPVGHSVTDGNHIAYEIGKTYGYVRVLGKYPESGERNDYKGKYLPTTFRHNGFMLETEGFASDVVDVSVSSVNGGRYAKISYTVNNVGGTEAISGKLGIHADTQIGTNDSATVSVVKSEESGQVIGLSMLDDNGSVDTNDDAQFSLYFADVAGIDPELEADTYWFGWYGGADDHCFDQLSSSTKNSSEYNEDYTTLTGEDSGMAVSWNVDVPAGKSVTYSVIVGAGAAAKPIKWAESDPLTWKLVDNKLAVTAKVVDESVGAFDTLFYNLDGEEMQFDSVKVETPAGTNITKEIELSTGNHVLYFYVGNDLGGFTTQKAVPVAVPDGDDTTYNIDGTITSSSNIELKLMQGDKVIAQTITDEDGKYQFVNLPKGDYNLVIITAEGATTTVLVTVAGDVHADTITPPAAESIVDNTNAGDFAATVGGLDSIAEARSSDITLTVTAEEEDEHDEEQAKIMSIAGEQELAFIDITLTCSVNGDIGNNNDQLLSIVISFNGEGKQDIQVYSYHDGDEAANKMKKNPAEGEEGFKYENGFVTIHAKRFSTYAIGYTEVSDIPVYNGGYDIPVIVPSDDTDKNEAKEDTIVSCPRDNTCPIWPYIDAGVDAWYHDGVHYCIENGIMGGYGNGIFRPNVAVSRAQISAMLWNMEGNPVVNYALDYTDVPADAWYTEAVRWMVSQNIAGGYGKGIYAPDDTLTREQLAAILQKYAQYKGYDMAANKEVDLQSYSDAASISDWAYTSMQWICDSGIVGGMPGTNGDIILAPTGHATRAQVATMLMTFCEMEKE